MTTLTLVTDTTRPVASAASGAQVARELADFHRRQAGRLPLDSEDRGLVLRCSIRWDRIAISREQEENR